MAVEDQNNFPDLNDDLSPEFSIDLNDPLTLAERVYHLWGNWADFQLYIVSPAIPLNKPPLIHKPQPLSDMETEHVYDIHDFGSMLSTSKASEMYVAGMSMCKLYYTIEKMIYLLVKRIDEVGGNKDTEVQVAFGGYLGAERKAFESIINLEYNVVVTNFDPGEWGERYLQIVKNNAERFGYPPGAPRGTYKQIHKPASVKL